MVIAISAILKAGKDIIGKVRKSLTHPYQSLSKTFAIDPPSIIIRLILAFLSLLKNRVKIIMAEISQNIQKRALGKINPQLMP